MEKQAHPDGGGASLARLLLFGSVALNLGLVGGKPCARQHPTGTAGGSGVNDLVEDVDQAVEGIDIGRGALEHERG